MKRWLENIPEDWQKKEAGEETAEKGEQAAEEGEQGGLQQNIEFSEEMNKELDQDLSGSVEVPGELIKQELDPDHLGFMQDPGELELPGLGKGEMMKGNEMETVFFVKEELMESDYEDPLETDNIAKSTEYSQERKTSLQPIIDSTSVLSDADALYDMKPESKKNYLRNFNLLREFVGDQLETRPPSEDEMLAFIKHLREDKAMASSTLWAMYSMINSVSKGKYSFNMKQYSKVSQLLKSCDTDVQKKANIFQTKDINRFVHEDGISTPYWLVRKVVACLAYYGGLRSTEVMGLQVELCESTPEGVYVTHTRTKQRSDQRSSARFLVPRTEENSCADVLDLYLRAIKDTLGKDTGRLLWTGTAKIFINTPLGRNTVSKIPQEMALRLQLQNPDGYSFQSFRRSAAAAAADAGATSNQMMDFFGWSTPKMTTDYVSNSNPASAASLPVSCLIPNLNGP